MPVTTRATPISHIRVPAGSVCGRVTVCFTKLRSGLRPVRFRGLMRESVEGTWAGI